MSDFDNVLDIFKDQIVLPTDLREYKWYENGSSVSWTEESDVEKLHEEEGLTYRECVLEGPSERNGFALYTLSDGCGGDFQAILSLGNKVEVRYD